jgi:serine/threonine protein kinase
MDAFLSTPQLDRARARVGTVLKQKWRLERIIGVGGMATVYAAAHRTGHAVAVKVLHAELALIEELRARFAQEPYVANRVEHKGVVRVIDDDVADDGAPFVVMELLAGQPLDELCRQRGGRLPPDEALEIADQILDVLAAAHAVHILHRDVKPQNIFVTRDGIIKLLDFGIARVEQASTMTRTGGVIGTPAFMPPEQARGRVEMVDERSDVWAVGATLFTMLSGEYVHTAGTAAEFLAAAMTPARSIAAVMPGLPAPVVDLVTRALVYERADRWPTARAMQVSTREAKTLLSGARGPGAMFRLPSRTSDPGDTSPVCGAGGTLLLRDSIPDWFAPRPGTVLVPPAHVVQEEASEDGDTNPRLPDTTGLSAQMPPGEESAPPADRWYVSNGAVDVGPVTMALVRRGVEAGKIPDESLIRHETWDAWQPLSEVLPNVRGKVGSVPPPAPVTSDEATQTVPFPPAAGAVDAHTKVDPVPHPAPVTDAGVPKTAPAFPRNRRVVPAHVQRMVSSAPSPAAVTGGGVTQTWPSPSRSRRVGFALMAVVGAVCAVVATAAGLRDPSVANLHGSRTSVGSASPPSVPATPERATDDPMPREDPARTASVPPTAELQATEGAPTPADTPGTTSALPHVQAPYERRGAAADPSAIATSRGLPTSAAAPIVVEPPANDPTSNEAQLRQRLEPKVWSGKASIVEIGWLKALCTRQHDYSCRDRASAALLHAQEADNPYN